MSIAEVMPHRTDAKRGRKKRVAPGVYLRAGKYLVTYIDVGGRERLQTTEARSLTEAKAIRESLRVKARSGEAVAPNKLTVEDVAQEFLSVLESLVVAGERSERTLELRRQQYEQHIRPRVGGIRVQALRAEHLSALLAGLRKEGKASWTLKGIFGTLSSILDHAVTRGLIVESPLKRLSKAERPKPKSVREHRRLSDEECERLIGHALPNYRLILATAVFTGMRLSELLALRWQDLDFEEGVIRVRHQLSKATRKQPARLVALKTPRAKRNIEMLSRLAEVLRAHKAEALEHGRHRPESFVFTTSQGTPLYGRNVSVRGLTKAAERAGLNPRAVHPLQMHDLRRTAISRWIAIGLDVVTVSRMAGHARTSITLDIYADEFEKAKRGVEIRERLEHGTKIKLAI